ncbi:hypothetical protein KR044_001172, partial [Drosophila immigrans]
MPTLVDVLQIYREQLQQLEIVLICVKLIRRLKLICQLKTGCYNDELSLKPILGGLLLAVLGIRLDQLRADQLMMTIHSTSLLLNIGLLGFFYSHADPATRSRNGFWQKLLLIFLLITLCLWYSLVHKAARVQKSISLLRTGIVSALLLLGLMRQTAKKKCNIWGCFLSLLIATAKLMSEVTTLNNFRLQQQLLILGLSMLRMIHTLL